MEYARNAYDAIIVGSGPNGLAAGIHLAQHGASVLLVEGAKNIGGGMRSAELTLPGFVHDVCSAAHPMGILSPFFRQLPLADYGLEWIKPPASVAHPLDDEPAVMLWPSIDETSVGLGKDADAYRRLVSYFVQRGSDLMGDALAPLKLPKNPWLMLRFGLLAMRSAEGLARSRFKGHQAQALFAGCAAHAIRPLQHSLTAALGIIFAVTGHMEPWPVVAGGSQGITDALSKYFQDLGGEIRTENWVTRLDTLPPAKVYLMDTDPAQLSRLGQGVLPERYRRRLEGYRYGPGSFKIDWALDGPIPWADETVKLASTVHVGGTLEEISHAENEVWHGRHASRPFVLVVQQSQFDASRAPPGQHTGYAYCHVPSDSQRDMTSEIEAQIERFAPGFKDRILARHTTNARQWSAYNPNYVGGAIAGGVADLAQLFARPVHWKNPYATPHPQIFICSASTPPGGGVHGMCGFYAAKSALRRIQKMKSARPIR